MTKRKRDPKPRNVKTTPIDLPADQGALILCDEGAKLFLPDFVHFADLPPSAKLAWALWARLNNDDAWRHQLTRELAAWSNELARQQEDLAASSAKSRGAVMVGISHAVH
jgi:hypothetical protein